MLRAAHDALSHCQAHHMVQSILHLSYDVTTYEKMAQQDETAEQYTASVTVCHERAAYPHHVADQ